MRRARDEKGQPLRAYVCTSCKKNDCNGCIDVVRSVLRDAPDICKCRRAEHSGESISQQILDPETKTVYAPGATIEENGEVRFSREDRR